MPRCLTTLAILSLLAFAPSPDPRAGAAAPAPSPGLVRSPVQDARLLLLRPDAPEMNRRAPDRFRVRLDTSRGPIVVEVRRAWAPLGADRFYNLVAGGYYDESRFFRVIKGKWAQFGINGDPRVAAAWRDRTIPDDPRVETNARGTVAFAFAVPNGRTTQVFINLQDNGATHDQEPFVPFGHVVEGMEAADALYSDYGETSGGGIRAGKQAPLFEGGNRFLAEHFPRLDLIRRATVLARDAGPAVRDPGRDQMAAAGRPAARPATFMVEFEALLATAQVSYQASAPIRQDMAGFGSAWSGDAQLFWRPPPPVDSPTRNWPHLTLYLRIAAPGTYRVGLVYTQAPDFGNARVFLKGQPRGDLAGYAPDVRTARIDLGEVTLQAGNVECLVTVFGKSAQSSGFAIGLDRLELTRK